VDVKCNEINALYYVCLPVFPPLRGGNSPDGADCFPGVGKGVMNFVVGIDPGAVGGVAVVSVQKNRLRLVDGFRMPMHKLNTGKQIVDAADVFERLVDYTVDAAIIESGIAMPRQSSVSTFSQGRNCGSIEAVMFIMADTLGWVTPRQWKKDLGLSSDKQQSIDLAKNIFKGDYTWTKKADDGIAEAALIAAWFLREMGKVNYDH